MSGRRGHLVVEEVVERDGFGAAGAESAVADSGHEGVAVLAALLAECADAAGGAFVDGDWASWQSWRDHDGGGLGVVAAPVGDGFAGVGAELSSSVGRERLAADGAGHRDGIVTQRGAGGHGFVAVMARRVASARARWVRIR